MQRIEADAVGAKTMRQFDQTLQIGKVADLSIAPGANAVKLNREQPTAIEIAAEGARGGDDQRQVLGRRGGTVTSRR